MYKKLIIATFLLLTTQAQAQKQALLVGISNYGGDPRNDLVGINLDIEKMEKLFKNWGFTTNVLYDKDSLQIEQYLKSYGESLSQDDTFALYYSGHGSYLADESGDEKDGQDEALVLSDGFSNIPFVDDLLHQNLNQIRAKKLLIFDSCHSGTVHKGNSTGAMAKTLSTNLLAKPTSKGLKVGGDGMSGEYIVLSASKDYEESLATSGGSLFTNEIYRIFTNASEKPLDSVREEVTYNIVTYCKQSRNKPHHPNFSFSNPSFGAKSIDSYIKVSSTEQIAVDETLQTELDRVVMSAGANQIVIGEKKESYNRGEFVNFTLNTGANRGYLTMLYIDKSDITVLYPNPKLTSKPIQGAYSFPRDFGNFKIRAYKSCKGCQEEKTAIYLLLTPELLGSIESMTRDKLLSFAKGSSMARIISKAVEVVEESRVGSASKLLIGKYEFLVR